MNDILSGKRFLRIVLAVAVFGVAWIIVAGIVRHSFWISASSLLAGAVCVGGALKLHSLKPERALSILGMAVLWCVITNFVFVNLLSLSTPHALNDANAPFRAAELSTLNIQIGLLSSVGFLLIIMDMTGGRRN